MEAKSPATTFAQKVIEAFRKDITDNIFLYIENNRDLMDKYLDTISVSDRKTVNSWLGRLIKEEFMVENEIDEETGRSIKGNPKSVLIKTSYTKHTSGND